MVYRRFVDGNALFYRYTSKAIGNYSFGVFNIIIPYKVFLERQTYFFNGFSREKNGNERAKLNDWDFCVIC